MSNLSKDDIGHIAELAKLEIDDAEREKLSQKLSAILDLVEKMQTANTHNIEPMSHAIFQNQKLRNDQAIPSEEKRDALQPLSTSVADGFYLVPKVID